MRKSLCVAVVVFSGIRVAPAVAQSLPTSQPNYLQIVIEDVKAGHADDHSKFEAGWPAAFDKAKSPDFYIGLASLTGAPQAWFIQPYESNKAIGDSMKRNDDDPMLAAELSRLQRGDAAHINNVRTILLVGRKDLSRGDFPEVGKQRFYQITIFRVRPGHEQEFEAVAKAYGAASSRSAPENSYRVYEVAGGMPGPVYFIFNSVVSHADFDKGFTDDQATMKGMTSDEMALMQKFGAEGMINAETQRFRVDPSMSYVPKEVRASDPAFWNPKKPAMKTTTQQQNR